MSRFSKKLYYCSRSVILSAIIIAGLLPYLPSYAADITSNLQSNSEIMFQERLRRLEEELRCLVCQNQSLADSNADLANDLRREVEQLARNGKNDQEIVTFLKERYGDFVSYRPPFTTTTALLWLSPLLFLGIAIGGLVFYSRRHRISSKIAPSLSPDEKIRAFSLLGLDDIDSEEQ